VKSSASAFLVLARRLTIACWRSSARWRFRHSSRRRSCPATGFSGAIHVWSASDGSLVHHLLSPGDSNMGPIVWSADSRCSPRAPRPGCAFGAWAVPEADEPGSAVAQTNRIRST
jgi:hypothetical protein